MVETRQLRHFVVLAETLNYRIASEQLHMAQPALSASIHRLETSIGCMLFDRSRRGTALTAAGTQALAVARRVLAGTAEFGEVARETLAGARGTLCLGYVASSAYAVFPKVLPLFRARHPHVQLRLIERNSQDVLALVENRQADVGIMRTPLDRATEAHVQVFCREEFMAALPDEPPWRCRHAVGLAELAAEPFIIYEASYAKAMAFNLCQQAGFLPRVAQEASGLPTVLSLVQCGLGVALVPAVASLWKVPGVLVKPLDGSRTMDRMGLALASLSEEIGPAVRSFRDTVLEVFREAP